MIYSLEKNFLCSQKPFLLADKLGDHPLYCNPPLLYFHIESCSRGGFSDEWSIHFKGIFVGHKNLFLLATTKLDDPYISPPSNNIKGCGKSCRGYAHVLSSSFFFGVDWLVLEHH